MKRITKMTLFVLALAGLAGLVVFAAPAVVNAQDPNAVSFDVACDCRTGATLDGGVRAAPFMIQGKIFPPGTLPSGIASNDPTLPVNGVASIGDWICRGQVQGTYPPAFILKDGRALTAEGYDLPAGGVLSVTGGIGGFSGAAGDLQGIILGTNATGCPNFRAQFRIQPGSVRGRSN